MGRLTDTWFNPNKECWELQRTGGVELTFRNTVISTPTWLSLWRKKTKSAYYSVTSFSHWHSEYRTTWIMGGKKDNDKEETLRSNSLRYLWWFPSWTPEPSSPSSVLGASAVSEACFFSMISPRSNMAWSLKFTTLMAVKKTATTAEYTPATNRLGGRAWRGRGGEN